MTSCFTLSNLTADETSQIEPLLPRPPRSRCRLTGALATACGDDAVRVFKEEETSDPDQPVFSMVAQKSKAHNQDVNCVAWNPKEEGLLASCSDDGDIAIWRFKEEN